MLKIRTQKKAQYWIEVNGGNFLVEPLSLTESTNLRKQFTTVKRGVEEIDTSALFAARVDKTIKEWDCVDESEAPLECSSKNKRIFADLNANDAADVLNRAAELNGESEIAELANLGE